jgi:hypothetical protein
MKPLTATGKIESKIFELLEENPEGLRWSELNFRVKESDPVLHPKTINGIVWKLLSKYPDKVYKPEKGVFRLLKYKNRKSN